MKIGYLGPRGTLTEEAVEKFLPSLDSELQHTQAAASLPYLMEDLHQGEYTFGVVPAENSLEGSVNATWDWLVFRSELKILAETALPVNHYLVGHRAQKLGDIKTVLSHPQALAQCREFLRRHLPQAQEFQTVSTAEAARIVSVNRLPVAAIASPRAARIYGLDILANNIQDVPENYTRFLLLGAGPIKELTGKKYKTTLVCGVHRDRPGGLRDILTLFAERGLNLTRIESRPARKSLGDYIFLIDVEGKIDQDPVTEVIHQLESQDSLIKILGSYAVLD